MLNRVRVTYSKHPGKAAFLAFPHNQRSGTMKRTTKMVVYGLAVATLLGTTLAETSMAGKRGKKRPVKSARSGKDPKRTTGNRFDVAGHLMVEATGTRKDPKRTSSNRSDVGNHLLIESSGTRKDPKRTSSNRSDVGNHLIVESSGTRKDPKRTTGKRGKKRPKKSARSGKYPFSDAGAEPGIRKAPKSTTVKRGKNRPAKSVLGFPFSLRRKAR